MKHILIVGLLAVAGLGLRAAPETQRPDYRVVFDLTSRDTLEQKAALRWVGEVSAASRDAQVEVVMYGKGFDLVTQGSKYAVQVRDAMKNPNVKFKVCEVALRNNGVDRTQLIPGVETVPDGLYEIVSKQQAHWGYIKVVAH
jgi:intracellular sulfur oxidation DsrE/DsrF family protein